MIAVENLTKAYNSKPVVDNVSFQLPKEKIIAFIGGNGAGKSTILSIISRLIDKDQGVVTIDGKSLDQWDTGELSKQLSILSQSNHFNIRLTVKELVSFGRFPHSRGKLTHEDRHLIKEALAFTGLLDLSHRYLDELSGGQRQMAFIAMLIAQDTEYILLDEPLNNLDMRRSVQVMQLLRRLVDEKGKTVIVVIHDINFVSCHADYIVAIKDGEIAMTGDTDQVIKQDVLKDIYDMDIEIQCIQGKNICLYYQ